MLDDEPRAAGLAFENHDVVALRVDLGTGGDSGKNFLIVATVEGEIARNFGVDAVQGEIAVERRHYVLIERPHGGLTGDTFARRLQEDGIRSVELQNRFESLVAKILHPSITESGDANQGGSLRDSGIRDQKLNRQQGNSQNGKGARVPVLC